MPEMPEVESLRRFLAQRVIGRAITRIDIVAINALKTFDPSPEALYGLSVRAVGRHGKFLDIDAGQARLVFHLARAGWLRWSDDLPAIPPRPGKGPLAARIHLDDGSGFDLTEAGTQKRLAIHVVSDPQQVGGIRTLGPGPDRGLLRARRAARRPRFGGPGASQGGASRPACAGGHRQRLLR
jgi:formamidopyrimidine-DNA glycosylase